MINIADGGIQICGSNDGQLMNRGCDEDLRPLFAELRSQVSLSQTRAELAISPSCCD